MALQYYKKGSEYTVFTPEAYTAIGGANSGFVLVTGSELDALPILTVPDNPNGYNILNDFKETRLATYSGVDAIINRGKAGMIIVDSDTNSANAVAVYIYYNKQKIKLYPQSGGGGGSTPIVNNLTSTTAGSALDSTQGKVIKDLIDGLGTTYATIDYTNNLLVNAIAGTASSNVAVPILSSLVILNHTRTAIADEAIYIQGSFPDGVSVFLSYADGVNYIPLTVAKTELNAVTAVLPTGLAVGVYGVWVKSGTNRSDTVYINRPEGHSFDSPDAYTGAIVSILGNNLKIGVNSTAVRLVSLTTGISTPAIVPYADSHKVSFICPTLVTGESYTAYITNGYGGAAGEMAVDDTLLAIATTATTTAAITATAGGLQAGVDPVGLKVGWGARFGSFASNVYNVKTDSRVTLKAVGNGSTNDMPALQGMIDAASSAGGGTVYLPAGNYLCTKGSGDFLFVGLILKANVILMGAGPANTTITYGSASTISKFFSFDDSTNGVCNLTVVNTDSTGAFGSNLMNDGQNKFFKNVVWDIRLGDYIEINTVNKIAIQNCSWSQGNNSMGHGIASVSRCTYLNITDNNFIGTYGLTLYGSRRIVWENNNLTRDVARGRNSNTLHLLVIDFTQKIFLSKGKFLVANGPIPLVNASTLAPNDGESIIGESVGAPDSSVGTVTSATLNTLTDTSKNWSTTFALRPYVYIIAGKGVGQQRRIVSRTSTVLTLESNWAVIPDSTSKYSIDQQVREAVIVNNFFQDQQRGITLYYCALHNVVVEFNTLIASGSIDLDPVQGTQNSATQFAPMYGITVASNMLDARTDVDNGTFIGVHAVQHASQSGAVLGSLSIGLSIIKNTLIASTPNVDAIVDDRYKNGLFAYHEYQGSGYTDTGIPVVWCPLIQNNNVVNCDKAIYVNAGTHLLVTKGNRLSGTPVLVSENTKVAGTSIKTTNF